LARNDVEPAGTPVSKALTPPDDEKLSEAVRDALSAIDTVHGDGSLPEIPVEPKPSGIEGYYKFEIRTREPLRIELRKNQPAPAFHLVHEVGHFLDHQVLGMRGRFESESDEHGKLAELFKRIDESDVIKRMRKLQGQDYFFIKNQRGRREQRKVPKQVLKYLLEPAEIFARAYAQYTSVRSANPRLLVEFGATRAAAEEIQCYWSDADFAGIAAAFDDLLESLGWIRKRQTGTEAS
jgi:hypothetical protein